MCFRSVAATLLVTSSLAYPRAPAPKGGTTAPPELRYARSTAATTRITTSVEKYVVWVDATKWVQRKSDNPNELVFSHVNGEVGAKVNTHGPAVSTRALWYETVLPGVKSADPDAAITFKERRIVNGRPILAVQMAAKIEGDLWGILGYYHGGSSGSVQVIGFARAPIFNKNIGEITEFLNGLEVSDQEIVSPANRYAKVHPGLISLRPTMSLTYDPKRWKPLQAPSDEFSEFTDFSFEHLSGRGDVDVAISSYSIPLDDLPDGSLSEIQSHYGNTKVLIKEKRNVNGTDVWFLEVEITVNKVPIITGGYYYGDKDGTVQIMIFVEKAAFNEYENDFMSFLNGLVTSKGSQT